MNPKGSRFVGAESSKNVYIFACEATPDASATQVARCPSQKMAIGHIFLNLNQ